MFSCNSCLFVDDQVYGLCAKSLCSVLDEILSNMEVLVMNLRLLFCMR